MFSHFFTYATELPENSIGFKTYDMAHLLFLAAIAVYITAICFFYKKASTKGREKFRKHYAIFILCLEVLRRVVLLIVSDFNAEEIPLHLCGISSFIFMWHAFRPNKSNSEITYSLSLLGAVAALAFPNWNMYPMFNFFLMHSFIQHANLAAYPIMLLAAGDLKPDFKNIWRPVVFLVITGFPLYFLNKVLGTNFMFLNTPSPGSPLVFLEKIFGNPGYIFGLAMLLFAFWILMYTPFMIKNKKKKAFIKFIHDQRIERAQHVDEEPALATDQCL